MEALMDKMPENCSVCLQIGTDFRKIAEIDENNQSLLSKLRSCVSEINWKDDYSICSSCVSDLNQVYAFRERCLNSENIRKQKVALPETEKSDEIEAKKFVCESTTQLRAHSVKTNKTKTLKSFICTICNRRFGCSSNLTQHLKYHKGNRSHICTFCGKSYMTKNDLTIHEKTHLNKREYKCEKCPKSFNTHKDLRSHKLVVHTDPSLWQHVCEMCEKRFPIKSNYDAHMRRHKDERPFACHLCDKKFIDKCVLQKHFRSHTNIRAFVCEVCKKEYKDKRVMDIHRAKIHGIGDVKIPIKEKRYFCHVCPKSYFEKNKLTRHLCTHTGERPYFCKICQKNFSCKYYVSQHAKKVHNFVENQNS